MNAIDLFLPLGVGFIAWYLSGLHDDLLILIALLRERQKKEVIQIFAGQLVGVITITVLALTFAGQFESNMYTNIFAGVILIGIGLWTFIISGNSKAPKQKNRYLFIVSFLAYVLNAFDDFCILSGGLFSLEYPQTLFFACGFLIGWATSFVIAYHSLRLKWIENWAKFAPAFLIIGGAYLIISALT